MNLRGLQSGARVALMAAVMFGTVAPANAATTKRPIKEIEAEIGQATQTIGSLCISSELLDPKYRRALTDKALPPLKQRADLLAELVAGYPTYQPKVRFEQLKTQAEIAFFNKTKITETPAGAGGKPDAAARDLSAALLKWWEGTDDADAQAKALDDVDALIKTNPRDDDTARALKMMIDGNPATQDLAVRASDTLTKLKTPFALQYAAMPNKVGKPLSILGATVDGKPWRSEKLKGKVILVDFWATWCPPCREEVPRVAKIYQEYHDKGLEIIGVSSDNDRKELMSFLKQHPEMPWPQLFAGGNEWHPLTKKFDIKAIPTMYLIDRQGVLRTKLARETMEEMIPKLLDEPVPASTSAKPAKNG